MPHTLDLDLKTEQIAQLTSADAIAAFLHDLGYPTGKRRTLAPKGLNLGDTERAVTHAEIVSEDDDGFLRVVYVSLKSVTAKARADLVRSFGKDAVADHLLILTSDFDTLEFVLIDKEQRQRRGVQSGVATVPRPRVFVVPRRWSQHSLRIVRRLTYTMDDGLRQFDKLRSVFDAAHFSGAHFTNRALFADHYLETRLRDDSAWRDDPGPSFISAHKLIDPAPERVGGKPVADTRRELYDPLWSILGFNATANERGKGDGIQPDYHLNDADGKTRAVALTYPWLRWLDGPDHNDTNRPDENPGAAVVSLLERGDADWAIVTNGKHWRLYSRAAHSRSTNFYEVDLQDALISSGLTDPNEAFRYWWLFFRLEAFVPVTQDPSKVWLDTVSEGSRDYARGVEDELKKRVFYDVVPMLAHGFLHDRKKRLKHRAQPSEAEFERIRQGTLTLLYRILFLLYAESRDLLPVREEPYYRNSLKKMKEEIADLAGVSLTEADRKLDEKYSKLSTDLYDRLSDPKTGLFAAMAFGRASANVPRYNGGLFRLDPDEAADEHEAIICEFLNEHKVPDAFLAVAIDRLARVENPKLEGSPLEFVDYKSLGVRQLGSIYEGLLEFKLALASEDIAVVSTKKKTDYIPLSKARGGSGGRGRKRIEKEYRKGEPILVRDKAERKATGSYYTPDHIVEYIVQNTVGPVLQRKLDALRDEFRKAEKTYHTLLSNAEADPRTMLGWRPELGAPLEGDPGKPSSRDRRRFALAKTYEKHKNLVERLFDLKVLDPAMGSGHFLVEAVDFITDEMLDFLNAFPVNPVSAAIERTREAILESLREQGLEVDELLRRQLTDIHLLKRHVLKRCIYGVDLNPLATELAKVSLWLDCFTLGAPLSFLDHHLRTGNSLIGTSLTELEEVIHDQLFKIDESHLLRAVQNVLLVARLADATASEVAESKRAFDEARKTLSGYAVLLDILVARHFDKDKATAILEYGGDLDLTTRESFFAGLTDADRRLVGEVAELAIEQRFFHWDIEFPEVFYEFTGTGESRIARKSDDNAGFNAVIGNPPYDVLAELELGIDLTGLKKYIAGTKSFAPSLRGKNNLYKLFVCRGLPLLADGAQLGYIVPMAILGDDQATDVRREILRLGAFRAIEAFPQKDDPKRRVFEEAKLSTALFIAQRTSDDTRQQSRFPARQHQSKTIDNHSNKITLSGNDLSLYDPDRFSIVVCSQTDWDLAIRIIRSGRFCRLGSIATSFQGEVNETTHSDFINYSGDGPLIVRGAAVCLYSARHASQGKPAYLDKAGYLSGKRPNSKAWAFRERRVGFQRMSPQNNFRRLIMAPLEPECFCFDSVSYFPESQSRIPLELVMAIFNSKLADWYFRLGSTNATINEYQVDNLPCPIFGDGMDKSQIAVRKHASQAMHRGDFDECFGILRPAMDEPPFGIAVQEVIVELVSAIQCIERARGEIARSARSALDPEAQPYQDLIDRIFFALADLTPDESRQLEERLANML